MLSEVRMIFRRFPRAKAAPKGEPDLESFSALTFLLEDATPSDDLFSKIEAQIDAEADMSSGARATHPWRWIWVGLALALLGIGLGVHHLTSPKSQAVFVRPGATAEWLQLGTVTLRGPALRAFVQGKCDGHTHFFILMEGVSIEDIEAAPGSGQNLIAGGEKIIMECIF